MTYGRSTRTRNIRNPASPAPNTRCRASGWCHAALPAPARPDPGVTFGRNVMSLLATRDSVSTPGVNNIGGRGQTHLNAVWTALQANAVPLFFCAAFWALTHPYARIIHDARIYIGRGMAVFHPAGLGRDRMFVDDGQFAFILFPLLIRGLVAHLGPGAAAYGGARPCDSPRERPSGVTSLGLGLRAAARLRLEGSRKRGDVGGAEGFW